VLIREPESGDIYSAYLKKVDEKAFCPIIDFYEATSKDLWWNSDWQDLSAIVSL